MQKRWTYQCLNPLPDDYDRGFVFRRRTQLLWQFDNGPGQSLKLSNVSAPFSNYPTHLRTGNKHFDSQRHITIMRICEAFDFELFINEVLRLKYKRTNVNKSSKLFIKWYKLCSCRRGEFMPGDLNSNFRVAVNFVLLQNKKRPKWPKKI